MHDNHETQKINQTSVMPEKTGVYWNSRFSIAPMLDWQDLHHSDLSVSQLYALLQLRCAVFVVEQNCPYQDIDGDDLEGENRHILGWHNGTLVAYARILKSDDELQPVVIGRVIVSEALRGEKIGQQLMSKALESCTRRWPEKPIYLGAQA